MKKDKMIPRRRALLQISACLGAAATARVLLTGEAPAPGPTKAAPPPAAGPGAARHPAAVPRAGAPLHTSAYRLQPMTADAPNGYRRPAPPVRQKPFMELPGLGHAMVLTFDDGPDPRYTRQILRVLREHDVRAMFFVCGEMVSYYGDMLRETADDGHVVGNHTWTHPELPKLSRARIREEMERTSEQIEKTIGTAPLWFRAPYGSWNQDAFELGSELGMEPLAWTIDTEDWMVPGVGKIVGAVQDGAEPGAVVLQHDAGGIRTQSVAALRRYLPELIDDGYRIAVPHR
ncbi:polysaccharide deacetylase family protein [Streptomyces sp. NPDC088725]|uniref:polysaccharide deacetylase family protein n=1 Tax=Streptomyces sp. NPDC088725 TaxID=3365873 RepID=UPI0038140046